MVNSYKIQIAVDFAYIANNIFPFTSITNKLQSVFSNEEYHVDDYIGNSTNVLHISHKKT